MFEWEYSISYSLIIAGKTFSCDPDISIPKPKPIYLISYYTICDLINLYEVMVQNKCIDLVYARIRLIGLKIYLIVDIF